LFAPQRIEVQSLDLIDGVVAELISAAKANETSIMVIGAHCRDLLHAAFGRTDLLRSTNDVDIALAVNGHSEYQKITSALPRSGTTDIRYSIAGVAVDVVPFGDIEDPAGTTSLPGRGESLDVFGFQEVFDQSIELLMPSGYRVRLPLPAGYAALKLKAWCDRSANGEYKDAADIATACGWYQQDNDIRASLYEPDTGHTDLLIRADMGVDLAALYLLGGDISEVLGKARVGELAAAWTRADREMLAEVLRPGTVESASRPCCSTRCDSGYDRFSGLQRRGLIRYTTRRRGGMKACNTTGAGATGGYTEHAFNWDVVVGVRDTLSAKGFQVVMTRPTIPASGPASMNGRRSAIGAMPRPWSRFTQTVPRGGCEFARFPRRLLIPAAQRDPGKSVDTPGQDPARWARGGGIRSLHLRRVRGAEPAGDLSGLDLSERPTALIECGNMRHPGDTALLESPDGRARIAAAISAAIITYLG